MNHILIVEDEPRYLKFLEKTLQLNHYQVTSVSDPMEGLEIYENTDIDLVISDLKMTPIDGLQFIYLVREINERAKVIFLTSSDDIEDELKGLSLKANDYVRKDVAMKVLLKRIELVLAQQLVFQHRELSSESENITIKVNQRKVFKNDEYVKLTMREYDLLVWFLKNKNIILEREKLVRDVWHVNESHIDVRTIDTHVKRLRKKLDISCIFSIRGVGYEWVE